MKGLKGVMNGLANGVMKGEQKPGETRGKNMMNLNCMRSHVLE